MAKTELILTQNVVGLGAESDQVKVSAGYARNYLLPQGLAIPVTAANKRRLEVLRQRRAEREAHELQTMTELAQTLSKLTLTITVKTGEDGKLFGSVTPGTIADELKSHYDATVDKRKIHLDHPIKTAGDYDVELRLHPEVNSKLKVKVVSTTPAPAQEPAAPAKAEDSKAGKAVSKGVKPEAKREKPESKPRPAKAEKA